MAGLYRAPSRAETATQSAQRLSRTARRKSNDAGSTKTGSRPERDEKFSDRYGDQLICVRYRYDEERCKRFTTVEIIVEESD
jgi:hypothetical protein